MYRGKKISLVLPAFNEENNIAQAIDDFKKLSIIDEIIIVDNNSHDNTAKIALKKQTKVVSENKQGYGFALQKGMTVANGDYIILCEPDGTFLASDSIVLLNYLDNFDAVIGTRTNKKFIGKNANMSGFLRLGNIFLAKIAQYLYRPSCKLSDCGCTFRALKKSVVRNIVPQLTVGGSYFLSDLLVLMLKSKYKIVETPVHYRKRIGESKITGSFWKAVIVGLQMFQIIIRNKLP